MALAYFGKHTKPDMDQAELKFKIDWLVKQKRAEKKAHEEQARKHRK